MTVKLLVTGVAAVAAVGAAAAGVTAVAYSSFGTSPVSTVQPVALSVPLPLDPPPAPNLPNDGELSSLLTNLTNPGVSYHDKTGLVEGGISGEEGRNADHTLRDAYRDGKFPLAFDVSNIQAAGPNAATADVATSGPKLPAPVTQNYRFVNQGGWVVSHDSAMALMQTISSS